MTIKSTAKFQEEFQQPLLMGCGKKSYLKVSLYLKVKKEKQSLRKKRSAVEMKVSCNWPIFLMTNEWTLGPFFVRSSGFGRHHNSDWRTKMIKTKKKRFWFWGSNRLDRKHPAEVVDEREVFSLLLEKKYMFLLLLFKVSERF